MSPIGPKDGAGPGTGGGRFRGSGRKRPVDPPQFALPSLAGSTGRLLRAAGKDIPVEVTWQSGNELTLEQKGLTGALSFPAVEELVLECTARRGMVRLAGELSPGQNRRLHFDVHQVIEVEQRRRFVRVRVSRPVRITRESNGRVSDTFALDLSGGGLLLAGPDQISPGEHIRFRLRLDSGSEPIEGIARVVRVEGSGHPALTFDSIVPADRERLIHFIFDRERAGRALEFETKSSTDEHEPGGGK